MCSARYLSCAYWISETINRVPGAASTQTAKLLKMITSYASCYNVPSTPSSKVTKDGINDPADSAQRNGVRHSQKMEPIGDWRGQPRGCG